MATFGELCQAWFASFLDLPHGILTQDTFDGVFVALDPAATRAAKAARMAAITGVLSAQVIALDGMTLRDSQDEPQEPQAIHLVRVWATANQLVLAQVTVDV